MAGTLASVDIEFNKAEMRALERTLAAIPNGANKALCTALNDTGKTLERRIVGGINKVVNVKKKDIRRFIHLHRATWHRLIASITLTGGKDSRVPLFQFGARQTKRGVSYKIERAGGRQMAEGAFLATMVLTSMHRGAFRRSPYWTHRYPRGGSRTGQKHGLKIMELKGPSVVSVYQRHLGPKTIADGGELLRKNVDRQIERLLKKGVA